MNGMRPGGRWLVVALLLLAFGLAACSPVREAPKPRATGPALWRVEDSDTRIWLFGTVHVLPPAMAWRRPQIDAALAGSRLLVLETPVDSAGAAALAAEAQRLGALPAGETLDQLLSRNDRARLSRAVARLHLLPEHVQRLQPWAAVLQLTLAQAMAEGQDPAAGVEQVLTREASQRGQAMRYFETAREQVGLLAGLPRPAQLSFLRATLLQLETEPQAKAELDRLWLAGDSAGMAQRLAKDFESSGAAIRTILIDSRNARWTNEIETMLSRERGEVFVAVGVAHLVGEGSVVQRLQQDGLTVEAD